MRLSCGLVLLLLSSAAPSVAVASPAREPMRRALRQASDDVRECAGRVDLPAGRYVFRVFVETEWGRVSRVAVDEAPGPLSPAQQSCLHAAYLRIQFPHFGPPRPRQAAERVPRLRRARAPRPLHWIVVWPVQLSRDASGS